MFDGGDAGGDDETVTAALGVATVRIVVVARLVAKVPESAVRVSAVAEEAVVVVVAGTGVGIGVGIGVSCAVGELG